MVVDHIVPAIFYAVTVGRCANSRHSRLIGSRSHCLLHPGCKGTMVVTPSIYSQGQFSRLGVSSWVPAKSNKVS